MNSKTKNNIKRTYSCTVCGKNVSSSVALTFHIQTHSGIKSFCCEYCGMMYSTKQNLMAHLIRIHNIDAVSIKECDVCGKQFLKKSSFDTHYLIHSGHKPFNCHICNKYFRQKITRDSHLATHTGDYKYSCPHCSKKFPSSYKLKLHMKKHKEIISNLISKDLNLVLEKKGVRYTTKCNQDIFSEEQNSNSMDQLKNTASCHTPLSVEESVCYKTLLKNYNNETQNGNLISEQNCLIEKISISNKTSASPPTESIGTKNFTCPDCLKHFRSLQGLVYHRKAHKGSYNFICEVCGKLFIRNSHFVSHCKTHSSIRKFNCIFCVKSYKSKKNLNAHVKMKHS